jgi:Protein of unknown function (DUF2510)
MGFFSRPDDREPSHSARYLQNAPPGTRADHLTAAATLQARELPVAAADKYGDLLTVAALAPASERVAQMMAKDRDLSAWIARKSAVALASMLQSGMAGTFEENLDEAFASAGLEIAERVRSRNGAAALPEIEREAAEALGVAVLGLLKIVTSNPSQWEPSDRAWYESLYTGADGQDVEGFAYELIAWSSVVVSRLLNSNRLDQSLPMLQPAYREPPAFLGAGWYPNPPKHGQVFRGEAQIQRYWDGDRWTDRVRMSDGRSARELTHSLHDKPVD